MRISYDDQYLFSVGQDGSLFVFKVTDKDGRGLKREKDITFAEEVLVTKSDLEEKNTMMSELKTRVEELKMENDYQLRLKDMSYGEKIKDLTDKFLQEIEALKARNEVQLVVNSNYKSWRNHPSGLTHDIVHLCSKLIDSLQWQCVCTCTNTGS